ncbi:MAG: hypothetical protein IT260_00875 [Saprospiraceae bacterium]|nr:hypothetical protein [Saprospiraceae bacterium]
MTDSIKQHASLLLLLCLAAFSAQASTPPDTTQQLLQLERQLSKGEKWTGSILTDTNWMPLHHLYSFRSLIRQHAKAAKLRLVPYSEPGVLLRIDGYLLQPDGEPAANALLYVYQRDYQGWFGDAGADIPGPEGNRQHARLFGYLKTDTNGYFAFETVRPGLEEQGVPQRIYCEIYAGEKTLRTELLFKDDLELNPESTFWAIQQGLQVAPNFGIRQQPQYTYRLMLP